MGRSVENASAKTKAVIYYAGDSTVQFNCIDTYPQTGLGQVIQRFLKDEYRVENHGKNGRSTKSFIDEGRMRLIGERISEGDFLFIQFGHNDEKKQDETRYTRPFAEYQENLEKFIRLAEEKKAYPVLITPLERCHFEDGHLYKGEHTEYVIAMKETAQKLMVPCIDLNAESRKIMEEAGETRAAIYFMSDKTHMTMEGAVRFGYIISDALIKLGGIYKDMVIEELL